jgi:hypothetical protein
LIDSENRKAFITRAQANNDKVAQLAKEADDLAGQAKKLEADNPNMFKK